MKEHTRIALGEQEVFIQREDQVEVVPAAELHDKHEVVKDSCSFRLGVMYALASMVTGQGNTSEVTS